MTQPEAPRSSSERNSRYDLKHRRRRCCCNIRLLTKSPLRSTEWFGRAGKYGFIPRSWMKSQGFSAELFDGRPVIGICNTWSELTNCNRHLRDLAEHVKRGVLMAGGFPLEFPVDQSRRAADAADHDDVPQPRRHGCRGDDPRQSDRRRRAAGRLRQDHPGAADGGGELRCPGHPRFRRADAERVAIAAGSSAPAPMCSSSTRTIAPARSARLSSMPPRRR